MILKVQVDYGWLYFDNVDRFEIYEQERSIEENTECPTQIIFQTYGEKATKFIKILMLFTAGQLMNRIKIDLNTAYLMSNEGKTIERIN